VGWQPGESISSSTPWGQGGIPRPMWWNSRPYPPSSSSYFGWRSWGNQKIKKYGIREVAFIL